MHCTTIHFRALMTRYLPWALIVIFWIAIFSYRASTYTVLGGISLVLSGVALVFLLSGKPKFSIYSVSFLVAFIWVLHSIKRAFWKEKFLFSDLTVLMDPANFETAVHYPIPALIALLAGLLVIYVSYRLYKSEKPLLRCLPRCLITLPIIGGCLWGSVYAIEKGQVAWLQSMPGGSNVIGNLMMSANLKYQSPASRMASNEKFPEVTVAHGDTKNKPDLILLLQESTTNPLFYKGIDQTTMPAMTMFNSPAATIQGPLRVHTYGGATWRSEFSALTGLSSEDFAPFSSSVFYSAVFHVQDSVIKRLKEAGYTVVVLSPFTEGSYNSGKVYRHLGVDDILHPADLGYPANTNKNLWKIKTADMLALIKKTLARYEGPVAVYALTMQEHGPYPVEEVSSPKLKTMADIEVSNEERLHLESYFQKLSDASQAVSAFDVWVKERKEPTIFVRFGDHQPALRWKPGYTLSFERPDYITHFALIDNRTEDHHTLTQLTDIVFLSGLFLERMPIEQGQFFATNSKMRQLCEGRYLDCPNKKLLRAYQNEIFVNQKIAE